MNPPLTLAELHRIKQWHVVNKDAHPLEYQLWDGLLCLWLMGWVGWLPVFALEAHWAALPCLLAMGSPRFYVTWRTRAHQARRIRCEWLDRLA